MSIIEQLTIQSEKPEDIDAITRVTQQAFLDAEHTSHTEHFIVNALRAQQQLTISLVAKLDSKIVGHIAISPVTLSNQEESHWYGLAPVSVAPNVQGLGVGRRLVKAALEQLKALGAKGCVVLGDPNYYSKFGFIADTTLTLADVPPEYFQALSFSDQIPHAEVSYHDSFNATH